MICSHILEQYGVGLVRSDHINLQAEITSWPVQVAIRPPRAAVRYKEREQCIDGTDLVENSQDSILTFKKAFVSFLFG